MDPLSIIKKYYIEGSPLYNGLVEHSRLVAQKALQIAALAPNLEIDLVFVEQAALLHDIGIFQCDAQDIGCWGTHPYIQHGVIGSDILKAEGYEKHALVCERHTGSGIPLQQIIEQDMPLPHRDMLPVSMEEKLICFADKFYSKSHPGEERDIEKIRKSMARFGPESLQRFDDLVDLFM